VITLCLAIAIALAADHFLGEPPLRWHPLVWLGDAADRVEAALRNESDSTTWQLKLGAFAVGAVVLIAMLPFLLLGAVLPVLDGGAGSARRGALPDGQHA